MPSYCAMSFDSGANDEYLSGDDEDVDGANRSPPVHHLIGNVLGEGDGAKNGYANEALILFCQMQSEDVKPELVTMVSVLPACADLAVLQQGKTARGCNFKCGGGRVFSYSGFMPANFARASKELTPAITAKKRMANLSSIWKRNKLPRRRKKMNLKMKRNSWMTNELIYSDGIIIGQDDYEGKSLRMNNEAISALYELGNQRQTSDYQETSALFDTERKETDLTCGVDGGESSEICAPPSSPLDEEAKASTSGLSCGTLIKATA
eukprot:Gb_05284 [translate_table: standard]